MDGSKVAAFVSVLRQIAIALAGVDYYPKVAQCLPPLGPRLGKSVDTVHGIAYMLKDIIIRGYILWHLFRISSGNLVK